MDFGSVPSRNADGSISQLSEGLYTVIVGTGEEKIEVDTEVLFSRDRSVPTNLIGMNFLKKCHLEMNGRDYVRLDTKQ